MEQEPPSHDTLLFALPGGDRAIDQIERDWKEGASRIESQFAIDRLDPDDDGYLRKAFQYVTDHLDNVARCNLSFVHRPLNIPPYVEEVRSRADELYCLAESLSQRVESPAKATEFLSAVRAVLCDSRPLYWQAQALGRVRQLEIAKNDSHAAQVPEPTEANLPALNTAFISEWMDAEGWTNTTLADKLSLSPRVISSIRNNGSLHGLPAITKLANLMQRDPDELYLG
jgi:hypothetical protein